MKKIITRINNPIQKGQTASSPVINQVLAKRHRSIPNIIVPGRSEIWKHKEFYYTINRTLPSCKYSIDMLYKSSIFNKFQEIQMAFFLIKNKENRLAQLSNPNELLSENSSEVRNALDIAYKNKNIFDSTNHPSVLLDTIIPRSQIDPDMFAFTVEIWDRFVVTSTPSHEEYNTMNNQYSTRANSHIKLSDIPNQIFDILMTLIPKIPSSDPSSVSSWDDFDKFWEPIINSPICVILIPQLVSRTCQLYSPQIGLALLYHIDNDEFIDKTKDSRSAYSRYCKGINAGLNSIICFLSSYRLNVTNAGKISSSTNQEESQSFTKPLSTKQQQLKNCDEIYDVIDNINLAPEYLRIFPFAIFNVFRELPKQTMADFYALLLAKNTNFQNKKLRNFIDQILLNGTDAERSLILNADLMIHLKNSNLEQEQEQNEINNNDSIETTTPQSISTEPSQELETKTIPSTFSLGTYKLILKIAAKTGNTELENFIKDKVLMNFAKSDYSTESIIEIALHSSVEHGNLEETGIIYEYLTKQPNFEPSLSILSTIFRGFRIMNSPIGESKCFEILDIIHSKGWSIPLNLCTEILALLKEQYHAIIVYNYYKAYFGNSEILDDLMFGRYFDESVVPSNISPPNYRPYIFPNGVSPESSNDPNIIIKRISTHENTIEKSPSSSSSTISTTTEPAPSNNERLECYYKFSSVALIILYESILRSVQHIPHVEMLYDAFRHSKFYNRNDVYPAVIDSFVRTLCTQFGNPIALSLARSIIVDMVDHNPSYRKLERAIPPEKLGLPSDYDYYKNRDLENSSSNYSDSDSFLFNNNNNNISSQKLQPPSPSPHHLSFSDFPSSMSPKRYTGLRFQSFGTLIQYYCRNKAIGNAQDILELACRTSPFINGKMFEPIIYFHIFKENNIQAAEKWYNIAYDLGAYITSRPILEALGIVEPEKTD